MVVVNFILQKKASFFNEFHYLKDFHLHKLFYTLNEILMIVGSSNMTGYIGVTSREWFTYLSQNNNIDEVNFWRKITNNFRVLTEGESFFFLVKTETRNKGDS